MIHFNICTRYGIKLCEKILPASFYNRILLVL